MMYRTCTRSAVPRRRRQKSGLDQLSSHGVDPIPYLLAVWQGFAWSPAAPLGPRAFAAAVSVGARGRSSGESGGTTDLSAAAASALTPDSSVPRSPPLQPSLRLLWLREEFSIPWGAAAFTIAVGTCDYHLVVSWCHDIGQPVTEPPHSLPRANHSKMLARLRCASPGVPAALRWFSAASEQMEKGGKSRLPSCPCTSR